MTPLIELKNISVEYPTADKQTLKVLDQVNLRIHQGEFVAIMGSSGSGKTTLANIIGLLSAPTSGDYFFDKERMTELSEAEKDSLRETKIGMIFQDYILIDHLTALENVELPLAYAPLSFAQIRTAAKNEMKALGLEQKFSNYPSQLSGGQKQRVAIARALVKKPLLLLADEPTGALDHASKAEVIEILKGLQAQGITIIMVTHSLEEAMNAGRLVRIENGKIIEDMNERLQKKRA